MLNNLVFNFCRESGDHGPFNSWDRQLFVTYKGLGTTGYYTDWNTLSQNFFIANYESSQSVDNDDGRCVLSAQSISRQPSPPPPFSCYYNTSMNLMMYGGDGENSKGGGPVHASVSPLTPPPLRTLSI